MERYGKIQKRNKNGLKYLENNRLQKYKLNSSITQNLNVGKIDLNHGVEEISFRSDNLTWTRKYGYY